MKTMRIATITVNGVTSQYLNGVKSDISCYEQYPLSHTHIHNTQKLKTS